MSKKDHTMKLVFALVFFPTAIGALYAAASSFSEGLFIYTAGGIEYSIGTVGYTVNGVQAILKVTFGYATPPSWPAIIRGIPKLLVAHFAVSVLLGIYVVMCATVFWNLFHDRSKNTTAGQRAKGSGLPAIKEAAHHRGVLSYVTPVVILIVIGLIAADLAVVISSFEVGDGVSIRAFQPTTAGYGLLITAGILGAIWLLMWAYLMWTYKKAKTTERTAETSEERKARKAKEARKR